MKKRLLSFIMASLMLISVFGNISAYAEGEVEKYEFKDLKALELILRKKDGVYEARNLTPDNLQGKFEGKIKYYEIDTAILFSDISSLKFRIVLEDGSDAFLVIDELGYKFNNGESENIPVENIKGKSIKINVKNNNGKNEKTFYNFELKKEYKITFYNDIEGKEKIKEISVKENNTISFDQLPELKKEGYKFIGFHLSNDKGTLYNKNELKNKQISEDINIYLDWIKSNNSGNNENPPGNNQQPNNPVPPVNPQPQPPVNNPQPPAVIGGGAANSSVRPDAVNANTANTNNAGETVINDDATPLAEFEDHFIARFKINAKEYFVRENDKVVSKTTDIAPMISQSRTLLPVRLTGEVLGVKADFDNATKTAKFIYVDSENKENVIEMTAGQKMMKVNGQEAALTADIMIVNGRIMLPVSDVQKALKDLGLQVELKWNHEKKEVTIVKSVK